MKLRLLFILAISLFTYKSASAQSMVELTGQVKDAEIKNSLEFCTISIFNLKDSLITGGVSDENGFFSIQVPMGYYRINFSFIGYQTDTLKNVVVSQNKFLGVIKLKPDVKFLKEISVKTSSNENTLDREVQIVTDKMKAGTTSTKEVLDKMSGVEYDRYTNSIKVDNSSKIIILVDGMEKDQEYIKNISPDRLKKIEVIRDPSGRYALEGYTAVINIVLKKDYIGTEILFQNNNLFDVDASKSKYIFVQNYSSATINYTYNKFNIYGKFYSNLNSFNLNSSVVKEFMADSITISQNPFANDMNTKVNQMNNSFTFGTDYTLNPKHTFSFEGNVTLQPMQKNVTTVDFDVTEKKNDVLLNSYRLFTQTKSKSTSSYYSFFYDGKIDEKNTFKSNLTFSNYSEEYDNTNHVNEILLSDEVGKNTKNKVQFYLEYNHIFNEKKTLQVGYGNSYESQDNSFVIETVKSEFSLYDYRNKFYSYYSCQASKKLGVKFGCAAETSSPNTTNGDYNYFIYLPYFDLKYKLSNAFDFKLKYRSNSEYPSISQTNPFESKIDYQSIRIGNPNLKPQVTHRLSLQTNILGDFAKIEPYYHYSNNYIADIGSMRSDSMVLYSYDNVGKYENFGVLINFTLPLSKSIYWQNDFDVFNTTILYKGIKNNMNDFSMSSQLIYVNEKSGFVGGVKYQKENRKYLTAQGFNRGNNDFWLAFVQKPFFKQRLSVMIAYLSPISYGVNFDQGSYYKSARYSETRTSDISILKNIFILEINYRFNKGKTINKKDKAVDVKSEKVSKGIM
jgi:hypothetical protein